MKKILCVLLIGLLFGLGVRPGETFAASGGLDYGVTASGDGWKLEFGILTINGRVTNSSGGDHDLTPWASYKKSINEVQTKSGASVDSCNKLFANCTNLVKVDLSALNLSGVTDMECMFFNCSSLTTLNLSMLDVSKVTDMNWLFSQCTGLKKLNIGNWTADAVESKSYVFDDCEALGEVTISKSAFAALKSELLPLFGEWEVSFSDGSRKKVVANIMDRITDKKFTILKIQDIASGTGWNLDYYGCLHLTADLHHSRKSSVPWKEYKDSIKKVVADNKITIGDYSNLFDGCKNLTSVDLSLTKDSSNIYADSMFTDCTALTSVSFSKTDTCCLCSAANMFENCKALTSIDLTHVSLASADSAANMFAGCTALKTITFNQTGLYRIRNMKEMFKDCAKLEVLDLSGIEPPQYYTDSNAMTLYYNDMLSGCSGLKKITIDGGISPYIAEQVAGLSDKWFDSSTQNRYPTKTDLFANKKKVTLTLSTDIATGQGWYLDKGGIFVFFGKVMMEIDKDTSIIVPWEKYKSQIVRVVAKEGSSLECGESLSNRGLFSGCTNLSAVDVDKLDVSKCKEFMNMFSGCTGLKSVAITGWDMSNAVRAKCLFEDCTNLERVVFCPKKNSTEMHFRWMFKNCSKLKEVDIGTVVVILENSREVFPGCSSLEKITVNQSMVNGLDKDMWPWTKELFEISPKWYSPEGKGVLCTDAASVAKLTGEKVTLTRASRCFTIRMENDGNGTAEAESDYAFTDETVAIKATPNAGYRFKCWEMAGAMPENINSAETTVTVESDDVILKAVFEATAPKATATPEPTKEPTKELTPEPTKEPTKELTPEPTKEPTPEPTKELTKELTPEPTKEPTPEPTTEPTKELTPEPTTEPTKELTPEPTTEPTPEATPKLTKELTQSDNSQKGEANEKDKGNGFIILVTALVGVLGVGGGAAAATVIMKKKKK